MKRYSGRDPYWLIVRYAGSCKTCGQAIPKGTRAFYYPNNHALLCPEHSEAAATDFRACAFYEAVYNGGY